MKHRIIISELDSDHANPKPVYEQVVDGVDLRSLITAINATPRKRVRDRSKKSAQQEETLL